VKRRLASLLAVDTLSDGQTLCEKLAVLGSALIALILVLFSPALGQEALTVNTTSAPPLANDEQTGFHDLLTREAFKRVGKSVDIVWLPGERSLINLNQGVDDATVVRIAGLESKYPNIRRVPEPMMRWEFVAFARDVEFRTSSWQSLSPYNVGIINGWKILEANVTGTQSLTKVGDAEQLFNLLGNDRADVIIYEKWEGLHLIESRGLEGIHMLQPPLANPQMFMYLHKKHSHLIPNLAAALKEIKQDGTYQNLFDRTLLPLRPN
jgi:polar amino acid transport system substrate-binding protein